MSSHRPQGRKRRSTFSNVASIESHGIHIGPSTTTATPGANTAQTERDQEYSKSVKAPVYLSEVTAEQQHLHHVSERAPERASQRTSRSSAHDFDKFDKGSAADSKAHVYYQITGDGTPPSHVIIDDDDEYNDEFKDNLREFAYGRRDSFSSAESHQDIHDHRRSNVGDVDLTPSGGATGADNSSESPFHDSRGTGVAGSSSNPINNFNGRRASSNSRKVLPPAASDNDVNSWVRHRNSVQTRSPLVNSSSYMGEDYAIDMEPDDPNHPSAIIEGNDDDVYSGGFPGERRFVDITSDEEPLNSEPGSRRDSDASSLNDVCFPLDSPRESGSVREIKIWPDLAILTEFAEQEIKEISSSGQEPVTSILRDIEEQEERSYSPFSTGSEFNKRYAAVNEAETVDGRLRPRRFVPWANSNKRNKNYKKRSSHLYSIPGVEENDASQYRFAYFREDMPATIHSPNISGLIQPLGMDFAKLFPPRISAVDPDQPRPHVPGAAPQTQTQTQPTEPSAASSVNHTSTAANTVVDEPVNISVNISTAPSASRSGVQTSVDNGDKQSFMEAPTNHADPVPFWLDVTDPTEEEMKVLSKAFGIHPLTTEDIFTREDREKVELFRNYYFVGFRSVDVNDRKRSSRKQEDDGDDNTGENTGHSVQPNSSRKDGYSLVGRRSTGNLKKGSESHSKNDNNNRKGRRRSISKAKKPELKALNMYIIVFHEGVLTFHFNQTPHPMNVRRRTRLLKDYMTVSSDWISYALIDDIVDGFAPMIEAIEEEVNEIEDAILRLHSTGTHSDSDFDDDDSDSESNNSGSSSESDSTNLKSWKQRGDMLRRIGECRKRVMSLLRLLGNKADVIKGFAKRCNERWEVAPRNEIGLYLGDIQDHVVTMVQSLNHYEKLLARSHSNYLAQINIDMTKTNNDLNDVLSKITVLGTMVLPMNIVTGLWGMNVLVPGQNDPDGGLRWFWGIVLGLLLFALVCAWVTKRYVKF